MTIGLTGGMGCGKSTAARFFETFGFRRIDFDALVRERVLTRPEVETALAGQFGPQVLNAEGRVDRAALATVVFADEKALRWLEELVHPSVFALYRELLAGAPEADWVVEVPLLHEKHLENWFDLTVCVATTSALQLARLEERGIPQALAEKRISKQLPLAQKLELSDHVLLNDGSTDFLREQVGQLIAGIRARR